MYKLEDCFETASKYSSESFVNLRDEENVSGFRQFQNNS